MHFKQFYLGCLSHASYYLGSGDEAAIIDPQRDVQQYLDEADANGQKIKYVIETHTRMPTLSAVTSSWQNAPAHRSFTASERPRSFRR
jgi:hydroxyacylglutathione hydrolase